MFAVIDDIPLCLDIERYQPEKLYCWHLSSKHLIFPATRHVWNFSMSFCLSSEFSIMTSKVSHDKFVSWLGAFRQATRVSHHISWPNISRERDTLRRDTFGRHKSFNSIWKITASLRILKPRPRRKYIDTFMLVLYILVALYNKRERGTWTAQRVKMFFLWFCTPTTTPPWKYFDARVRMVKRFQSFLMYLTP